jgi:multimeric flavodoxin WrbA
MRRLLLHDLDDFYAGLLPGSSPDIDVVAATPAVAKCIGCFGCWVRTPGECVIADRAQGFAAKLGAADEFIVLSRLFCGGPSPDIKVFLDRTIPYLLPYFNVVDGRMRHARRYESPLSLRYYYYLPPADEKGSVIISGGDDEAAGQSLDRLARAYENARLKNESTTRPSEDELDLMLRIAEANATNLRADKVVVEFIGAASDIGRLTL